MERFTHTQISHFSCCDDCPFSERRETEIQDFRVCSYTNEYITEYSNSRGDTDHRNSDGVLDSCPFLKQSSITDEE